MKFGDNLKLIRKSKNISQEELAEKLGVSRQSISKWETGENYPSMQNIMCLCTIFKCQINELVHEDFVDINYLDDEIKMNVVKFKKDEQKKMKGITKFITLVSKVFKYASVIAIVVSCIITVLSVYFLMNTKIDNKNNNVIVFNESINYEITGKTLRLKGIDNKEHVITFDKEIEEKTITRVLEMSKYSRVSLTILVDLSFIFAMYILYRLFSSIHDLFKNMRDFETPFSMENVSHVKKIALYTLLYILSQDVLGIILGLLYSLNFDIDIELTNYILVLILLAISYIFKYGYQIQLDTKGRMYGDTNE